VCPCHVQAHTTAVPADVAHHVPGEMTNAAHEASGHEGGHEEEKKPVDVLSLFVIALLIGVFTHHALKFTKIPYTALLMVRLGEGWG
jgi:hypothetical protein